MPQLVISGMPLDYGARKGGQALPTAKARNIPPGRIRTVHSDYPMASSFFCWCTGFRVPFYTVCNCPRRFLFRNLFVTFVVGTSLRVGSLFFTEAFGARYGAAAKQAKFLGPRKGFGRAGALPKVPSIVYLFNKSSRLQALRRQHILQSDSKFANAADHIRFRRRFVRIRVGA